MDAAAIAYQHANTRTHCGAGGCCHKHSYRCANPDAYGDTSADPNLDCCANGNPLADTDGNTTPDQHAYCHSDRHRHGDPDGNRGSHGDQHTLCDRDRNTGAHADLDIYPNGNSNADTAYKHGNSVAYCDTNAHCYRDADSNGNRYGYSICYRASSDANANSGNHRDAADHRCDGWH